MAVTYIVSRLKIRRKYKDSKGTSHTTVGLAWRRRHIFIVNSDDREGLQWFVCAIDCKVPVLAFKVHIWEPLSGNSLVWPMLKRLQSKGVAAHAWALGFQEDGWSCGYQSRHLCDEVAGHRGSLEDVDVSPLPNIRDACVWNTNPRAKPKASDTKTALISKRVLGDFLQLARRHYGCMRRM